jgi:hypothetical protein
VEGAAYPWPAFEPDFATHHVHQTSGDAESEACPSVFTGRRTVSLAESLEDRGLLLRRNANAGVLDVDLQAAPIVSQRGAANADGNASVPGKLYGIAHEVCDDLTNASGIAHQLVRQLGLNLN